MYDQWRDQSPTGLLVTGQPVQRINRPFAFAPIVMISACPALLRCTRRHAGWILGRSEATLTTSAATSTSSAPACTCFSLLHRRHRTAWLGHQIATGSVVRDPTRDLVAKTSPSSFAPKHMAAESWSDRSIVLCSLPAETCCRPPRMLRVVVGFDDNSDRAPLDLDRGQCAEAQRESQSVRNSWLVPFPPHRLVAQELLVPQLRGLQPSDTWTSSCGERSVVRTGESAKSSCVDSITALRQSRKCSPWSSQNTLSTRASSSSPI